MNEQLLKLMDATRPAMQTFKSPEMYPDVWLYFEDDVPEDSGFPEWIEEENLFEIPVINVGISAGLRASRVSDVECPLFPMWYGEALRWHDSARREFFLRFDKSGDF